MVAVGGSWLLSFFMTPAIAEYWSMGMKAERALALLIAFVGVNPPGRPAWDCGLLNGWRSCPGIGRDRCSRG